MLILLTESKPYGGHTIQENPMNKFEIEFYNGLIKGIVKCSGIVKKSPDLKEANEQIDDLLTRVQKKIDAMVEESLS